MFKIEDHQQLPSADKMRFIYGKLSQLWQNSSKMCSKCVTSIKKACIFCKTDRYFVIIFDVEKGELSLEKIYDIRGGCEYGKEDSADPYK